MTMSLLHMTPNPVALSEWATRKGWLSPDGDFGYALHALLADAFSGNPPSPFRYMDEQGLLAYSAEQEPTLREAITDASPEVRRVLGLESMRVRAFPAEWNAGKRLGFEVRVRPIVRTTKGKERDLYQYRMEQRPVDSTEDKPSREVIYRQWLEQRLTSDNAARLVNASLEGFALSRVVRRALSSDAKGQRSAKGVNGPDALFRGVLEVTDSAAFAGLVARGIGRHRAFGYGMLLLRPHQEG